MKFAILSSLRSTIRVGIWGWGAERLHSGHGPPHAGGNAVDAWCRAREDVLGPLLYRCSVEIRSMDGKPSVVGFLMVVRDLITK
jgi:hypothetical protein